MRYLSVLYSENKETRKLEIMDIKKYKVKDERKNIENNKGDRNEITRYYQEKMIGLYFRNIYSNGENICV